MKILLIASLAESLINFRGPLIRQMVSAGHEVIAAAPEISAVLCVKLRALGVRSFSIRLRRTGLNPIIDVCTILMLFRLCRLERPDVILAYTIKPVIYGSIAASWAGVPGIYSIITGLGYAFSSHDRRGSWVRRLARQLYREALKHNAKVFFQNPDDQSFFQSERMIRKIGQAILVNGSGVDLDYFRPAPLPAQCSFLLIARLIRDKGVEDYVRAARILRSKYPDARFRLAGWMDSNPNSISSDELAAWKKEGVIEYLGPLEDVRPAIRDCAVYVLPSYREGTPRTVLEAMAMGRPVITTDAPGCRETVRDGVNGYLVPIQRPDTLAEAMEKLYLDAELRFSMGQLSRKRAVDKYDVIIVNRMILGGMGL